MSLRIPSTLTIGAICLTLAWLVFLLIAKAQPIEAQSSDFLSPDPSTVDFEADGDIWHKFTVNSDRQVKVVINPTGSALRLEITFAHSRINVCPGEWNDTKTRNDGQYFFLSACTAGTATVELRDASDDSHIRTYTFNVRAAPTPTPTATPSPTPTPRPSLPPIRPDFASIIEAGNPEYERWVRQDIDELREGMPELARKIEGLSWIEDGIEGLREFGAFRGLIRLADAGHTARLIEEPWVVEGRNYPALESLSALAINYPETLDKIMSHPAISDGITDQEAKIVATLTTAANPVGYRLEDHDLLDKLLDPEQVTLEERTITLPLAGETEISIVRTRPGGDHTMDFLEHSVRSIEEFMGLPFPRQQVIYLFTEAQGGGIHHGTHVSIRADEQATSAESMFDIVAHEASHYYWRRSPSWMVEGGATFMESVVRDTLHGRLNTEPYGPPRSIAELEELERDPSTSREFSRCNYTLGERLFRDLYRNMDDTTFRLAFRRLYLHTVYDISNECNNADGRATICHVKEAFSAYAPEETAATVEKVIARWYDGTEPYDLSSIDDTPAKAEIAAINGRIEGAYLSFSRGGSPISAITVAGPDRGNVLYWNLDYSYGNSGGLESLPIEIAISFEDGFEFHRTVAELPAPTNGTRWTHHVGILYASAPGRYWAQAYWGEQKIAEATFEIIREIDPPSIRGVVTVQDGQPPGEMALWAKRGEERFWAEAGSDGAFDVAVPSGSFILEVLVLIDSYYRLVGYYDGGGGVTVDRSRAFEVVVDDANVEGIEIELTNEDLNRIL